VSHRRSPNYRARHAALRRSRRHYQQSVVPAVALTACALAATASTVLLPALSHAHVSQDSAAPLANLDADRLADLPASRSMDRQAVAVPATTTPSPTPPPPPAAPAPPPRPRPVAGLNQAQMDNAAIIVQVARARGLSKRAMVIGVATAMQESSLYNQANPAVRASMALPHQGASVDHDSVGLFQQRASMGWGSVTQLMNPQYAAGAFFNVLVQVPGWGRMSLATAAQSVQKSGLPWAYAKWESAAQQVVNALTG
jgi:hypothetical protein